MSSSSASKDTIKCLDKGFVRLVDAMGGDDAIVQAARVSYGKGTRKVNQDRGLIRYLMRHRHTTPFEMVEFKFHCKMPIFVARQWVRHRTANINEYSLRYSAARDDFYLPDPKNIKYQSTLNKQGREGHVPEELKQKVLAFFKEISERSYELYQEMNAAGIARELARGILPVNIYTEWYWKNDLHNLLHFINLRASSHAQYEIRVYADAMACFVKKTAPFAWEAYEDYVIKGLRFSGLEKQALAGSLPQRVVTDIMEDIFYEITASLHELKPRERTDIYALYQKQGGGDSENDFFLKWDSGEIKAGNIRELREFQNKLEELKT